MIYYRVKKQFNDKQLLKKNGVGWSYYGFLIPNELYTKNEIIRLQKNHVNISFDFFDPVEISKKNIYWFFGARFDSPLK